jgi:hypothetical protein
MTPMRFLLVAVVVLALISSVTAISLFKEEPPAGMPAGANVTLGESIEEQPQLPSHPTQLTVERINPANATPALLITITLKVSNRGNERVRALLTEDQRPGLQYPDPIPLRYHNYEALKIPYYAWNLTLEPGSTQTITYHVKPEAVGMIAFTAALLTDEYGNQVEAPMTSIRVSCIPNGVCDAGENTIFCPEDCPSGGSDGICDGSPDGKVDPDCLQGADPDSGVTPSATATKKGLLPGPSVAAIVVTLTFVFLLARRRHG